MKIIHISDTHNCHHLLKELPEAEVIVHSGDFTMNGSEQEAIDFINWFCDLPFPHKIFISGNHDECLYRANIEGLDKNVHYLCNSGIEIDNVKFYGVPMFMAECLSDFQSRNYALIPTDIDVLITHSPPFGILDFDDNIHYGSEDLLKYVRNISPRLHLFGHIHKQHGISSNEITTFSNGAIMNEEYSKLNTPTIIEL